MSNDYGNGRRWEGSDVSELSDEVCSEAQDLIDAREDTERAKDWVDGYAASVPPIALRRFITEQREMLKRFETYWIEQRMMDPESETFPEEMREPDWIEQLEFFRDITDKNL